MSKRFHKKTPKDEPEIEEDQIIEELRRRVVDEAPESGSQLKGSEGLRFSTMPLSPRTISGLSSAKLEIPTEIQTAAIPHALAGRDILGAAKTGSGKTLAFVIPMIERLYLEKWSLNDGLAAIVLTPTRELALQIFEVIRIVGRKHQLSAGLVTGGKKEFEKEQDQIVKMNILVATPGRLQHHFEQTPGFDASQLLVLILDEADRILDMGFKPQLDAILDYLPTTRQTLLFSATQTKSVKDLARLSLKRPEYLSVHAEEKLATPKNLIQNYVICKLPEKMDLLFSFMKSHLKSKMIVFFSTCSQVRYAFECIRGLQPGVPLSALHGKVKQERRTLIYMDFVRRKEACLLCTDIASRGLDFPDVDWVIQVDAPEDTPMYIHRVGRTARYTSSGRSLLFLMPHEEKPTLSTLTEAGIPITKLTINSAQTLSVQSRAAALLVSQPEWKSLAKKAFSSYLRSLMLLPGPRSVDISTLPLGAFATSLGLPFTPPIPSLIPTSSSSDGSLFGSELENHHSSSSSSTSTSSTSPALMDETEKESAREEVRKQKNVNRTLNKLKKQIKEAKEAKRKQREEIEAMKKTGGTTSTTPSNEQQVKMKKGSLKSVKGNEKEGNEEEEDDDLFVVKKVHDWSKENNDDEDDSQDENEKIKSTPSSSTTAAAKTTHLNSLQLMKKKEKETRLKISLDGTARLKGKQIIGELNEQTFDYSAAPSAAASTTSTTTSTITSKKGKKTVFDDEGEVIDDSLKIVVRPTTTKPITTTTTTTSTSTSTMNQEEETGEESKNEFSLLKTGERKISTTPLPEPNAERIQSHYQQIKSQLDGSRNEDNKRERERIREKKLELKNKLKNDALLLSKNNQQNGSGVAMLATAGGGDDDMYENDEEDEEDEDEVDQKLGRKYLHHSSDDDDDSDESEEEEEEEETSHSKKRSRGPLINKNKPTIIPNKPNQKKMKSTTSSSSIESDEALALQLMNR